MAYSRRAATSNCGNVTVFTAYQADELYEESSLNENQFYTAERRLKVFQFPSSLRQATLDQVRITILYPAVPLVIAD